MAKRESKPAVPKADTDLVEQALKRFRLVADAEAELRRKQVEERKFAAGDQWPVPLKTQREADGRPCLTINRLKPQLKQVMNAQRAMRPSVQVNPVEGGDVDTAEVYQGIIRHIETRSDADDAYDQAGRDQVEIGRGWFRIDTAYADDGGNLEIRVERIRNPFSVYCDPAAQRRDRSDMRYLFEGVDLEFDEYKRQYGDTRLAKAGSLDEFRDLGDEAARWLTDKVRVCNYWHVEGDGPTRKVVCEKINALEVIKRYEWPGRWIPYVPVLGEETDIEGKVDLHGMVRDGMDPQRMSNYWKSAATEMIALAPRAPFIVAEGQIDAYRTFWDHANTRNFPYLPYSPKTLGSTLAPPPQRNVAEPPIQAIMAAMVGAENDLRATTGFYDVNERESREQSGRAILARQKQGEHGNSDYLDGLSRAIRHAGRILVDLIPKVYDAQRVIRITGLDNQPKTVMVHAGQPPEPGSPLPAGVDKVFDLSVGTYDVVVSAGPAAQTARQEFVEQIAPILQSRPEFMQVFGDLFFDNLDVPNAKAIAERFRKMLPPPLQDQANQQNPAVLQAQLQQAGMQMQQMGAMLQQQKQIIDTKVVEAQSREKIAAAERELKERIAQAELDTKLRIEAIKADAQKARAFVDAQLTAQKLDAEAAQHAMAQNQQMQMQREQQAHESQIEQERGAREMDMAERQGQREMMQQQERRSDV